MTNEERWTMFIKELKEYIEEHHLCPPKHCTLFNEQKYYRLKLKEGKLDEEKARQLENVLALRDLSLHTGGRKRGLKQKD